MDKTLDYECVPHGYWHCLDNQCVRRDDCMRYSVVQNISSQYAAITIVNPKRIPEDTDTCPHSRPIRKVQVAWGIKQLFEQIPYKNAVPMRKQILSYFGKTKYYRFYRQECGLMPEDQAYVNRLFKQNGITEAPKYEKYTEQYSFQERSTNR